jgi:hypothetical protein
MAGDSTRMSPPMAPTPASSPLRIGTLSMQLPGVGADAGQRIARRVSALVAERLPAGLTGEIDRVALNVRAPAHGGEPALAAAVADAIVRAASRARGGDR